MEREIDGVLKLKVTAEAKFAENDIALARKFARVAQVFYPALDGIDQMIKTLDVHLASQVTVCGEKDLYGILCLNASADEETLNKQYMEMAQQLHPEKNKSVGAEGAFKLITEAWSTLSDKAKRMAYDQKTRSKESGVPVSKSTTTTPSFFWTSCDRCQIDFEYNRKYVEYNILCPNCRLPFFAKEIEPPTDRDEVIPWPSSEEQFSSHSSSGGSTHLGQSHSLFPSAEAPNNAQPGDHFGSSDDRDIHRPSSSMTPMPKAVPSTFWTSCHCSEVQFEYPRMFINQTILCRICHEPFLAKEIGSGVDGALSQFLWASHQQIPNHSSSTSRNTFLGQGVPSVTSSSSANAQAAQMSHEAYQKAKREHEEVLATVEGGDAVNKTGSSESWLKKKRTGPSDMTQDENIGLFTGQAKASEMGKVNEVSADISTDAKEKTDEKEEWKKEPEVDEDNEENIN